jgi:DNA mismatch endonuclease (patch repair protein)
VVFPRARIAVFIDGCYWHGCPDHYVPSKSNREYWERKIAGNARRDLTTTSTLMEAGWVVLRYWSHESSTVIAASIESRLRRARSGVS